MLSRNKCILFIFEEIALVTLLVMQVAYLIRLLLGLETYFPISYEHAIFQTTIWIICFIILLIIGHFYVVKRNPFIQYVHNNSSKIIFETIKMKVTKANRQIVVLVFLELLIVFFIAVSIYLYLDPEVNLVPFPFNVIAFIVLLLFMFSVFNKTKTFREATYGQGFLQSLLFPKEHVYPIKRLTNPRTGSIRIKPKYTHGPLKHHKIKKHH